MKVIITAVCFGLLVSCSPALDTDHNDKTPAPNIILFLVDDMGWQDTSVPFWSDTTENNRLYRTPSMDRLASEGMKFTQAYACSVCSPTRVSLMTGMNAARHRVTNWTLYRNRSTDAPDQRLDFSGWNFNGLQPVDTIEKSVYATTLPQILRDNGYYTIHCGKAHYGALTTPGADPLNLGFDINIAGHAAGAPGSYLGEKNFGNAERGGHTLPWGVPGLEKYHGDTVFLTEALTREAIAALDVALQKEKPFYLYMAHYAVHVPLEADSRYYQRYIELGLEEPEARYASMVEGMDRSLGDIMDWVEEKQLEDKTIIIFMSDNGGLSAHGRGGTPHTHNRPLNSGKGSAYEGGIREPMLVKWPGVTKQGSTTEDYVIIEDFFPSLLEMAGIKHYKTIQETDGRSFVPLLNGKDVRSNRSLVWHFPNKWIEEEGHGIATTSTLRRGRYKLIYYYKDQHFELFDINNDIGERNNLADIKPHKTHVMARKLGKYLRKVDATRPAYRETGTRAPWPDMTE